jgi:hypothetical protein
MQEPTKHSLGKFNVKRIQSLEKAHLYFSVFRLVEEYIPNFQSERIQL